jgi:hypothetical protein
MSTTTATEEQFVEKQCPILGDALLRLLRHDPSSMDAFFSRVCASEQIATTQTSVYCHYIRRDANGRVRVKDLAAHLKNEIVDYAIPRTRIEEAAREFDSTRSTVKMLELEQEARTLFTDLTNTGEGGEVLLYVLAESVLGIPQLFCRMPLKTSSRVHLHGVDGVHGMVDPKTGRLCLYWGESKLHRTVGKAVRDCFASISKILLSEGGSRSRARRDIQLLRDNVDLGDARLEGALRTYLDPTHVDHLNLEYRGLCLIGFDLANYPDPFDPDDGTTITRAATAELTKWKTSIGRSVNTTRIQSVVIDTICVPFPSVKEFREAFLTEMGLLHAAT